MTMSFIKHSYLFLLFLLCTSSVLEAQDNLTGYWQPDVGINYKITPNYAHNFSLAKRTYVFRDDQTQFTLRQLDVVHFSNLRIGADKSVGFGVQYRFRHLFERTKENELRFVQQYNVTKSTRGLRLGNRFRSEQRITKISTIHRFRYRFALDFPLQGEELDLGESYIVVSTEALLSVAKAAVPEYDQRLTANIGWLLEQNTKLQMGAEYRTENYTQGPEHVFFLLTSLVLSL
ncbi:MAG: hypothetical protein ACJAWH_001743 [Maribacter sp.]|jgi:hypothetical protein